MLNRQRLKYSTSNITYIIVPAGRREITVAFNFDGDRTVFGTVGCYELGIK
jgi:hypothetical protein